MSMKSRLREMFGYRVPIRDVVRVPSGSPARYVLKAEQPFHRTVAGTEALAKHGLSLLQAKRIMTRLAEGEGVAVEIPMVEDPQTFEGELDALGVSAERRDPPDRIDVKAVREHS
jgi:hypothetical protein